MAARKERLKTWPSKTGMVRVVWITILAAILLVSAPAAAVDIAKIAEAPPELLECIAQKMGSDLVADILEGNPPTDKKSRRRLEKTYERCAIRTGATVPKDITPYRGPLFDAMSQIDETVDHDAAIARVRTSGVNRIALFARSRKGLHQHEREVLTLARKNPDLIVLGAPKFFRLSGDLTEAYITASVQGIQRHGYRFIGEILYTHGDKKSGKRYPSGERYIDPSKPGTTETDLLTAIASLHIPLMTHWEPYAPERDFPRFHDLYDAWPEQIFIVPHMGFASPEQVEQFMGRHPNLYMVISKKDRRMEDFADPGKQASIGTAFLDGFRLRSQWREILVTYQDRLLFGTDPHMKKLWERYPITIKSQRLVLGQLPVEVAKNIAYKNAERLYGVTVK